MTLTFPQLCGLSNSHIAPQLNIHKEVIPSFLALQKAAKDAGFDLCIASGFRDFYRQRLIWNNKFTGKRPVLDRYAHPLNTSELSDIERIHAIMHWSSLPATSRHHWGSDMDIYAKNLLPAQVHLQLEPWEYEKEGHQYPFSQWLIANMHHYDFFLPYEKYLGGVAVEPWHISYYPLAQKAQTLLSKEALYQILKKVNKDFPIAGCSTILKNFNTLYSQYIINVNEVI